jgi:hypothetical protein
MADSVHSKTPTTNLLQASANLIISGNITLRREWNHCR